MQGTALLLLTIAMCCSKNYPHHPHGTDFSVDPPPPHLSGNSGQASYMYLNFWAFENPLPPPTPQEFPIPPLGGVWIFPGTTQFQLRCC